MAKKILTYEVADGSIQEGSEVFVKGVLYTPPTAALEKELLAAGVIKQPTVKLGKAQLRPKAAANKPTDQDDDQSDGDDDLDADADADADADDQDDLLGQGQ